MNLPRIPICPFLPLLVLGFSCKDTDPALPSSLAGELKLKRGAIVSCGPADQQFGSLRFAVTGKKEVQEDFALGLKLLHSFEYDEAEKVFAGIIDKDPQCAMAYWGVAMSNFHPLWAPPTEEELEKGAKAIEIAQAIEAKSEREADYIATTAAFYRNHEKKSHKARCLLFEGETDKLRLKYPEDKEATIFYTLALNAAADPADKSFAKQKRAGGILSALYKDQPDHPGVVHYLIHTYDAPELATLGLPAARRYASVAPSSAHALHMPSHIFTRLGLWEECIGSNLASVDAARCYAEATGIKGHWDEELHGLDYLVYAYLQRGQNDLAAKQLAYLNAITEVHPANFKVAYAFAAIPSRYVLENRNWKEAVNLELPGKNFTWETFPWQKALLHFTRGLGAVHTGNKDMANAEITELKRLHALLAEQKDNYRASQVEVQVKTLEGWRHYKRGNKSEALSLMRSAADLEDKTEKHPVTPAEVLPAREVLGDMLSQMGLWKEALSAYETNLKKHPNRFTGLYGAARAAQTLKDMEKARTYYDQLVRVAGPAASSRPEWKEAQQFLSGNRKL